MFIGGVGRVEGLQFGVVGRARSGCGEVRAWQPRFAFALCGLLSGFRVWGEGAEG